MPTTTSYTHTHTEKKEFISVKRRARLLEDIMTTPQPPFSSAEEAAAAAVGLRPTDDLSRETPPSTERSTPIKPEDIPGAVRVFPVPIAASSTPTASGNLHCNRSASVDMNGFVGSLGSASQSPMTLPRATKHFRSQSCHSETSAAAALTASEDELGLLLPTASSSKKFQGASYINSTITKESLSSEEKQQEEKTTPLTQSYTITDDLPPTIELTAYKCSNIDCGDDVDGQGHHQISGYDAAYEADTENTLNRREMKLFKPSKFVPKLASPSVWKPSVTRANATLS